MKTVLLKHSGTTGRCASDYDVGDWVTIYFHDCNGNQDSEYGVIAEVLEDE